MNHMINSNSGFDNNNNNHINRQNNENNPGIFGINDSHSSNRDCSNSNHCVDNIEPNSGSTDNSSSSGDVDLSSDDSATEDEDQLIIVEEKVHISNDVIFFVNNLPPMPWIYVHNKYCMYYFRIGENLCLNVVKRLP